MKEEIPRKLKCFRKKMTRLDKRDKKLKNILKWHKRCECEIYCPFCGVSSGWVKTNGAGFYRCKGDCKNRFVLLKCIED